MLKGGTVTQRFDQIATEQETPQSRGETLSMHDSLHFLGDGGMAIEEAT